MLLTDFLNSKDKICIMCTTEEEYRLCLSYNNPHILPVSYFERYKDDLGIGITPGGCYARGRFYYNENYTILYIHEILHGYELY